MRIIFWIVLAAIVLSIIPAVAVDAAALRTPPGSFITRSVDTPEDMANLIDKDSAVARRLSHHFGMSQGDLSQYFRDHVQVSRLDRNRTFTMYFIGRNGRVNTRRAVLQKGEKVFVAESGEPLMALRCGNPVAKHLPEVAEALPLPNGVSAIEMQPELVSVLVEPEPLDVLEISLAEPLEPEVIKVASNLPLQIGTPLAKSANWVLPLLAGGGVVLSNGDHNEVVPEPSSLLMLGAGGVPVLLMLRRRIRR